MKSIKLSLLVLITLFTGASLHAEEAIEEPWFWDIPTLRFEYEQEVLALKSEGDQMESEGLSNQEIAIALHEKRRALGVKYKEMTPEPLRKNIFERNQKKYGDPYGPTVDYLRNQGKSWAEIRESASRPGGGDLWYNRVSSSIGSWQKWLKETLKSYNFM